MPWPVLVSLGSWAIRLLLAGQGCRALTQKFDNSANDIQKRDNEIVVNPGNLPQLAPPGSPQKASVQGHVDKMNEQINQLGKRVNEYMKKCGGGPPPAISTNYGEVPSSRGVGPVRLPTMSPNAQEAFGLGVVGIVLLVVGAIALAPAGI